MWEQFRAAVISGLPLSNRSALLCGLVLVLMCESERQRMMDGKAALQTVCVDVFKTTCLTYFFNFRRDIFGVRVPVGGRVAEFGPQNTCSSEKQKMKV